MNYLWKLLQCFLYGHKVPPEWLEYENDLVEHPIPCERCNPAEDNPEQCRHEPFTYTMHPTGDVVTKCRKCKEILERLQATVTVAPHSSLEVAARQLAAVEDKP